VETGGKRDLIAEEMIRERQVLTDKVRRGVTEAVIERMRNEEIASREVEREANSRLLRRIMIDLLHLLISNSK